MSGMKPDMDGLTWRAQPVSLTALTDDESRTEATEAVQFGVRYKGKVQVFGDQEWVRFGDAAKELDGVTMQRDITIIYGPWRPVYSENGSCPCGHGPDEHQWLSVQQPAKCLRCDRCDGP